MEQYSHPVFNNIMRDQNNKSCFDCSSPHPKWASVNNGVFICINCAGIHRGLGVNISFVRSITMDSWDEKQIKFLKNGGNKRLREFLNEFNIPNSTNIELKYKLIGLDYYRKMVRKILNSNLQLRAEIFNEIRPPKPDLITAVEKIDEGLKREKNFDNNNFISSASVSNPEYPDANENKKKSGGFFGKVGNFFEKTASKIKEMQIADKTSKIIETSSKWFDQNSKKVINSQIVQNVVHKTKNLFVADPKDKLKINEDNIREVDYNRNNEYQFQPDPRDSNGNREQEFLSFFTEENPQENKNESHNQNDVDNKFSHNQEFEEIFTQANYTNYVNPQNSSNEMDFFFGNSNSNSNSIPRNKKIQNEELENIFSTNWNGNENLLNINSFPITNDDKNFEYPDFDNNFDSIKNSQNKNNFKDNSGNKNYPNFDNFYINHYQK